MTDERRPLTTRFTIDEYRLLEKARLRMRYRSLAAFLHDAALHYAGHNRNTVRPVRAFKRSQKDKPEGQAQV